MKRSKKLVVIVICLFSLCIGLVFTANVSNQANAYASENSGGFNEEYDILYADIVERHEQGLITMDEAEEELRELSRSAIIAGTYDNEQGIAPASLSVSGSVRWVPVSGAASEPLRGVKVVLYHRDTMGYNYIATTYTNNNGNYSFNMGFPWIFSYHTFISVCAEGETFRVARSWYSSITPLLQYTVETPNGYDVGANERHNLTIPYQENELFRAFSVSQAMYWAQRYAVEVGGMSQNKTVRVAYPAAGSFCADAAGIFGLGNSYVSGIEAGDWNDWNTIMHEYGHFVQGMKGILGQSLWDYFIYGMEHSGWEDQIHKTGYKTHGLQLSWSEAWAYAFAMMAYNNYAGEYGVREEIVDEINDYGDFGNEAITSDRYANRGEAQENAMIALLWDLFGARNTNLLADNWIPRGHAEFWSVSGQSGTYTMSDFASRLNTAYPQFRDQIGRRMSYFKIAPQELCVSFPPTQVTSPRFTWRVNGSQHNPNNRFGIAFYDANGIQKYEIDNVDFLLTADLSNPTREDLSQAKYTLTQDEWNSVLSHFVNDSTINVSVTGYLSSTPESGPYWSAYYAIPFNFAFLTFSPINNGNEYSVTGILKKPVNGYVEIPDTYQDRPVTAIGYMAFSGLNSLTKITLPEGLKSIGDYAFSNCTSIWGLTIPSTVTKIGNDAFYGCSSLTGAGMENGVKSIGRYAFAECSRLAYVSIPPSVESIGEFAFYGCNQLIDIYIPFVGNSLTEPGYFWGIFGSKSYVPSSLETVIIYGGKIAAGAFKDCGRLMRVDILDDVESIGEGAFAGCNSLQEMTIPFIGDTLDGKVNTRFWYIFGNVNSIPRSLKKLTVTGGSSIPEKAFLGCYSSEINILSDVTKIGNSAFTGCANLQSFEIPQSVTSIGDNAFDYCVSMTSVLIPNGVTSIGAYAFQSCSALSNLSIPESVKNIGANAFAGCFNLSITWEYNPMLTAASNSLFADHLKTIIIPSGITLLKIPERLATIGTNLLQNCSGITSVVIPESITNIQTNAFLNCNSLTTVYYGGMYQSTQQSQWEGMSIAEGNSLLSNATKYYYSANQPTTTGKYWYYDVDRVPVVWTQIVTFDINGGTGTPPDQITVEHGSIITARPFDANPSNFTLANHSNDGEWYIRTGTAANYTYTKFIFGTTPITENTTLYLNWTINAYSVTFNLNGGSGSFPTQTINHGSTVDKPSKNPIPPTDYTFEFWAPSTDLTQKYDWLAPVTENITLVALWQINSYTVTFNLDGGTGSFPSLTVDYGSTLNEPLTNPQRYNCTFKFWALSTNLNEEYNWSNPVTGNITLIAVWQMDEFMFTLSNDGTVYEISGTIYTGTKTNYDVVIPSTHNGLPVVRIADYAFYNNNNIVSVAIPSSMNSIGSFAFANCPKLISISVNENNQNYSSYDGILYNKTKTQIISVPNDKTGQFIISNTVTAVGDYAFYGCKKLTNIVIPNSVITIGAGAFANCILLENINVNSSNNNYKSIEGVLYNKTETILICYPAGKTETSFTIPLSVNHIGAYALSACVRLRTVIIEKTLGVINLGIDAFYGCYSYVTVIVPKSDLVRAYRRADNWSGVYVVSIYYNTASGVCFYENTTESVYAESNTNYFHYVFDSWSPECIHIITLSQPYMMTLYQGDLILAIGIGKLSARMIDPALGDIVLQIRCPEGSYFELASTLEVKELVLNFALVTDAADVVDIFDFEQFRSDYGYDWWSLYCSSFQAFPDNARLFPDYLFELYVFNAQWIMSSSWLSDCLANYYYTGLKGVMFYVQNPNFLEAVSEMQDSLWNNYGIMPSNFEMIIYTHYIPTDYQQPDYSQLIYSNDYLNGQDVAESFMQEYLSNGNPEAAVFLVRNKTVFFNQGIADMLGYYGWSEYIIIDVTTALDQYYQTGSINILQERLSKIYERFIYPYYTFHYILVDFFLPYEIHDLMESINDIYVFGSTYTYDTMLNDPYFRTIIASPGMYSYLPRMHFFLMYESMSSFVGEILYGLLTGDSQIYSYWQDMELTHGEYGYGHICGFFNEGIIVSFNTLGCGILEFFFKFATNWVLLF